MSEIKGMFADGGISEAGKAAFGSWAYCLVDAEGFHYEADYGLLLPDSHHLNYIECNTAEYYAFLRGLEALPDGWSGPVHTDSQNTLNRFFAGWKCNGIPEDWQVRARITLYRLGPLHPVLLAGHPTKAELAAGRKYKGTKHYPVSKHNIWCDKMCRERIKAHREAREVLMPV